MIEDEIIRHIPDAVGIAKVAAASIPFTAIVKRMLGPAADELAEMWRDQVRLYRCERQLKCVEKAEKMAKDAGFTPQAVPPKILFPLLEGASFEDNDDLHTMWAALLANASNPGEVVRPSFISILKQMTAHEAKMLLRLYEDDGREVTTENEFERKGITHTALCYFGGPSTMEAKFSELSDLLLSVDGLMAQLLIEKTYWKHEGGGVFVPIDVPLINPADFTYTVTFRGKRFFEACSPPQPKS